MFAVCFTKVHYLTLSILSNCNGLFHSLFWIALNRSVGLKGLKRTFCMLTLVLLPKLGGLGIDNSMLSTGSSMLSEGQNIDNNYSVINQNIKPDMFIQF